MTCDERLEALLNRAGQTISDLPESDGKHLTYDRDARSAAEHAVFGFAHQTGYVDVIDCLAMHQDYILHLTDIIDRMETALENVCGERDWLKSIFEDLSGCPACAHWKGRECEYDDDLCCPDGHAMYEYSGVPEDWRIDDGE